MIKDNQIIKLLVIWFSEFYVDTMKISMINVCDLPVLSLYNGIDLTMLYLSKS